MTLYNLTLKGLKLRVKKNISKLNVDNVQSPEVIGIPYNQPDESGLHKSKIELKCYAVFKR